MLKRGERIWVRAYSFGGGKKGSMRISVRGNNVVYLHKKSEGGGARLFRDVQGIGENRRARTEQRSLGSVDWLQVAVLVAVVCPRGSV